LESPSG